MPTTEIEWKKLSNEIYANWQFPNAIGAMDGKHIGIFNPPNSGSIYCNYHNRITNSSMLMWDAKGE